MSIRVVVSQYLRLFTDHDTRTRSANSYFSSACRAFDKNIADHRVFKFLVKTHELEDL